jgi:formylglycine-generating enzyme required for sulfatase activity
MVLIPGGTFIMGSDEGDNDEGPPHQVTVRDFSIDKTEVTNSHFARFLSDGNGSYYVSSMKIVKNGKGYRAQPGYENHPVVYVSWYGAKRYCSWAGKRLPTEAEWEKAARGTNGRTYPWGERIDSTKANYSNGGTTPVGSYPAGVSPYGVYDMVGNVWEWVADRYRDTYYSSSPSYDPQGPYWGPYHVLRGGSWNSTPEALRTTFRHINHRSKDVVGNVGFRCAR